MVVKVSVIVPVYNCERYVAAAVESVLAQNYRDLELIMIDDGSTDRTLDTISPYMDEVQVIRQSNLGVAAARNKGLAAARGEFVAFLDADDLWLPSRLAAQFSALALFPNAGLVFSDFCVVDDAAVPLIPRGIRTEYRLVHDSASMPWNRIFSHSQTIHWIDPTGGSHAAIAYIDNMARWLFFGNIIKTSTVLARRDVLEHVAGFDESLSTEEDYQCWLQAARHWQFVYIDEPLAAYRRRTGQLTGPDHMERVLRNVRIVIHRAAERMADIVCTREVNTRLLGLNRDIGLICLRTGRNREARYYLLRCLGNWPQQAMILVLLAFSFLPAGLFGRLERWLRAVRLRLRRVIA